MSSILMSFEFHQLLQPQFYIDNGGLWLLLFIVFAETGLFVGFFLPGDSLLFVAGIVSNKLAAYLFDTGSDVLNLVMIISMVSVAGVLGNTTGYFFGNKVGHAMYSWKENVLFKRHYLHQAHDFYEKHGAIAVVFARFLPIVRTFAPIIAGIVEMDKKKFSYFNIVGCIAWATTMIAGGHYLYKFFLVKYGFDLTLHLEVIVLVIVLVTTAPVIFKIIIGKRNHTN